MRKSVTPSAEGLAAANARLRQTLQTNILAQAAKQIQRHMPAQSVRAPLPVNTSPSPPGHYFDYAGGNTSGMAPAHA